MKHLNQGNAIVYCEGAYNTPNGKTAHGLIRFSKRYNILCVVDSKYSGQDAGSVLDDVFLNIPIYPSLKEALSILNANKNNVTHFIIGLAPDGGRLPDSALVDIKYAIQNKLNVVSGLHDFLADNKTIFDLANKYSVTLTDIRNTPPRHKLHFFKGVIQEVRSFKIALLGTDSAVGKRTTAWLLVNALDRRKINSELIGTGQTAWLQGAKYSLILDSLINDFVSGEIEHAIYSAWTEKKPEVIVIEGQGSLLNPAYPGGFEILAAGRPDAIVLQHAPRREEYDGFPGFTIHDLKKQIAVIELLSQKPVIAITVNHENIDNSQISKECEKIKNEINLPVFDALTDNGNALAEYVISYINKNS